MLINDTKLVSDLVGVALKQIKVATDFKRPRMDQIKKFEDNYMNKVDPKVTGFNIPIPVLGGLVDTLMAKIDDPPRIDFSGTEEADYLNAKKINAAWLIDSSSAFGRWSEKDRDAKKLAIFSGRAIFKYYANSDPDYSSNLNVIDYYDFLCEPLGGGHLDDHLFMGHSGIFKTDFDLNESKFYYSDATEKLLLLMSDDKKMEDYTKNNQNKFNRMKALGLSPDMNSYVGQKVIELTEWYLTYNGLKYYLLFDPISAVCLRCELLKDIYSDNLWPFVSWATHKDAFNFWSKGPCDDPYPITDYIRVSLNQALENRNKKNRPQRAYDPEVFTDPELLKYRPDGWVPGRSGAVKPLSAGVYEFQYGEVSGTIDLVAYLNNFLGQQTGITAEAQGVNQKDAKVGIYYGNLQQVSDRLGLYNKSYSDGWNDLGIRYVTGLKDHMSEARMVRIIGENGVEWKEFIKQDILTKYDVKVVSSSAELQSSQVKLKNRQMALSTIISNPLLLPQTNPKWILEEVLKNGEYDQDEIQIALDAKNENSQEIMSRAAQAIQDILEGKSPEVYRGATVGFVQKILNYATDNKIEMNIYKKLVEYAMSNIPNVKDNVIRKVLISKITEQGVPPQSTQPTAQSTQMPQTVPPGLSAQSTPTAPVAPTNNL